MQNKKLSDSLMLKHRLPLIVRSFFVETLIENNKNLQNKPKSRQPIHPICPGQPGFKPLSQNIGEPKLREPNRPLCPIGTSPSVQSRIVVEPKCLSPFVSEPKQPGTNQNNSFAVKISKYGSATIHTIGSIYFNLKKWHDGNIFGKLCAKNIVGDLAIAIG